MIGRLLLPVDEDASEGIQPRLGSFAHPTTSAVTYVSFSFLRPSQEPAAHSRTRPMLPDVLLVISLIHAEVMGNMTVDGGSKDMCLRVSATIYLSCVLALQPVRPTGRPFPSVSRLRFVPCLARSVGLGPVFFPSKRCLGHRPGHRLPLPVQPMQVIELRQGLRPKLLEDSPFHKHLEVSMNCAARTKLRRHRLPLTTRSQHVKNPSGTGRYPKRGRPHLWERRNLGKNGSTRSHTRSGMGNSAAICLHSVAILHLVS